MLESLSNVVAWSYEPWGGTGRVPVHAWLSLWPSVVCALTGVVVLVIGVRRRVRGRVLLGLMGIVSGAVQFILLSLWMELGSIS
jgi:hypothetical protein